jgi:hypothetical protein
MKIIIDLEETRRAVDEYLSKRGLSITPDMLEIRYEPIGNYGQDGVDFVGFTVDVGDLSLIVR